MGGEQALQLTQELFDKAKPFLKKNATTILTSVGAVGVGITAVSAAKGAVKAMTMIKKAEEEKGEELTKIEKFKASAPAYIPATVIGLSTVACIFGAHVLSKKQQAALVSAYALLDASYKEYREKVVEMFDKETDIEIKNAIAKDKYDENKVVKNVVKTDIPEKEFEDTTLFYEEYSNRFFESTLEDVKDAEYHFNRNFALRDYAELNELYEFLGLPQTEIGSILGWSLYAGQAVYGYEWIDFNHVKDVMDDGTEYYRIEMPFAPHADFMDY